ncbi:MAG: TetR/AcrR family transcriptional regulator [Alphaproteobacteria bacterium]|nr:MAG: TetR/AcrR family transcriptional regulator [Alphaproteobacteria bacterium]
MIHESKARLLEAALKVIRTKGYNATRIEDICQEAALTKGSFFHHFKGKEELALAAAEYWSQTTGELFENAPYHDHADPLARLLGYIDFRRDLLRGELPEFTCLVGTMVQEIYETVPAIRNACESSICGHAATLEGDIRAARKKYRPGGDWTDESLALYIQSVLQGSFVLAKARQRTTVAVDNLNHLRRYIEMLFPSFKPETGS